MTFDNITRAISAYQQSMNFTNNIWNKYVRGDVSALTQSQKRGAYLYLYMPPPPSDGGTEPDFLPTQCIGCHNTDTFSQTKDSNYHRLAFPQIGPGTGELGAETNDLGRASRNGNVEDIYSFRSGTLLNIEVTGPFGHAGNYDTLLQVIEHYDDYHKILDQYIDYQAWCKQPQFKSVANCQSLFPDVRYNTDLAVQIIDEEIADGAPVLQKLNLSEQSKLDLVNFMKALTDPCVKEASCLQAWLPQPEDGDPDRLQLHAMNYQGVPLYLRANCRDIGPLASGSKLNRDQGECISGQRQQLYFDVANDNSTVFLSSQGGEGELTLYYHPTRWATKQNAIAYSIGQNTEQVLKMTLNRGRHYVSAISQASFRQVSVAFSEQSALKEKGERPKVISDQCMSDPAHHLMELTHMSPICITEGDSYFFTDVRHPNTVLDIRVQHGVGDTDLYVGSYWPSRAQYTFSSKQAGNNEYLRIHAPNPGRYFILTSGDGLNRGATIQVDMAVSK